MNRPAQQTALLIRDKAELVAALLPIAARYRDEWTRGGHRTNSLGEPGSRGNDDPLPVAQVVTGRNPDGTPTRWGPIEPADRTDRAARRQWKNAEDALQRALTDLDRALLALSFFRPAPPAETTVTALPCSNYRCHNPLDGDRNQGECPRCRKHRSRYRRPWPEK
jgi:hypothetical protein